MQLPLSTRRIAIALNGVNSLAFKGVMLILVGKDLRKLDWENGEDMRKGKFKRVGGCELSGI